MGERKKTVVEKWEVVKKWYSEIKILQKIIALLILIGGVTIWVYQKTQQYIIDFGCYLQHSLILDISPIFVALITLFTPIILFWAIYYLYQNQKIKKKFIATSIALESKKDSITNYEALEKLIFNNLENNHDDSDYGKTVVEKYANQITTFPINHNYLKRVSHFSKIILFSRTKINIKDVQGKISNLERRINVLPIDRNVDKLTVDFSFTAKANIKSLIVDNIDHTNKIEEQSNGNGLKVNFDLNQEFSRFEVLQSKAEINIHNCFTEKVESWTIGNPHNPLLYEKISVTLPKEPKEFVCERRIGKRWLKATDEAMLLGTHESKQSFTFTYMINFQNLSNKDDYEKYFRIKWKK